MIRQQVVIDRRLAPHDCRLRIQRERVSAGAPLRQDARLFACIKRKQSIHVFDAQSAPAAYKWASNEEWSAGVARWSLEIEQR